MKRKRQDASERLWDEYRRALWPATEHPTEMAAIRAGFLMGAWAFYEVTFRKLKSETKTRSDIDFSVRLLNEMEALSQAAETGMEEPRL